MATLHSHNTGRLHVRASYAMLGEAPRAPRTAPTLPHPWCAWRCACMAHRNEASYARALACSQDGGDHSLVAGAKARLLGFQQSFRAHADEENEEEMMPEDVEVRQAACACSHPQVSLLTPMSAYLAGVQVCPCWKKKPPLRASPPCVPAAPAPPRPAPGPAHPGRAGGGGSEAEGCQPQQGPGFRVGHGLQEV